MKAISQQEFEDSTVIFSQIQGLLNRRSDEIERRGLNEIGYPGGNWRPENPDNSIHQYAHQVFKDGLSYDVVNRLRLFTGGYSGVPLLLDWNYETYTNKYAQYWPKELDRLIETDIVNNAKGYVKSFISAVRYLPKNYVVSPPPMFGEIGWKVGNTTINFDTYSYQERITILYETGVLGWLSDIAQRKGYITILEIGGGYGALAYYLSQIFPTCRYLLVDLPESLLWSSVYLKIANPAVKHTIYDGSNRDSLLGSEPGYSFVPNYMFDDLLDTTTGVDLAVNTLSFHEMTSAQVSNYASGLKQLLGSEGILFAQNPEVEQENENACDSKKILAEFFCRKRIFPQLITPTRGIPDLWATKEVSQIIDDSFRPFGSRWNLNYLSMLMHRFTEKIIIRLKGSTAVRRVLALLSANAPRNQRSAR